jgi:hypothetical protein
MNDQTTLGGSSKKRDDSTDRYDALNLALRTPGIEHYSEVIEAARGYQEYIVGDSPTSERELAMAELLRSACAIAERKGAETAWVRFANSIRDLGLNGVTARTYRILPSDEQ